MNRYREIEEKHKAERRELTDRVDQERLHIHPALQMGFLKAQEQKKGR